MDLANGDFMLSSSEEFLTGIKKVIPQDLITVVTEIAFLKISRQSSGYPIGDLDIAVR